MAKFKFIKTGDVREETDPEMIKMIRELDYFEEVVEKKKPAPSKAKAKKEEDE